MLEKSTYRDHVIDYLYNSILSGNINHGDRIVESLVSKELGISRAPVREALRELVAEGILIYKPQVGYFVIEITKQQVLNTYETRGVLEGFAARTAINQFTEEDIDTLYEILDNMEKLAFGNKHIEFINTGHQFHEFIFTKSPNNEAVEFTKKLSLKSHIFFNRYWMKIYSPENIRKRHESIILSIKNKDGRKLEETIREHYSSTARKIINLL
ncbi:MAG: transcriptional regulator, GntR family [Deferribacteraceae bacterium]|jgi:DNA-binding GntR family transcriptional regulator|nr:transcriptional regulator, GntR family [Deferribacteraceae bacterium]